MTPWPSKEIVLTVSPSLHPNGAVIFGPAGGTMFSGHIGDEMVVHRSETPFRDCARRLLADGVKPGTILTMRHEGMFHDAIVMTVGQAAAFFAPWQPQQRAEGKVASVPPMTDADLVASLTPPDERRVLEELE
jgi:Fe2+ transport system protein FeoA